MNITFTKSKSRREAAGQASGRVDQNPRGPAGRHTGTCASRQPRSGAHHKSACRGEARQARAARIQELSLDYMPSKEFGARAAEKRILAPTPLAVNSRKLKRPTDLPPYLASLYEVPLLTAE